MQASKHACMHAYIPSLEVYIHTRIYIHACKCSHAVRPDIIYETYKHAHKQRCGDKSTWMMSCCLSCLTRSWSWNSSLMSWMMSCCYCWRTKMNCCCCCCCCCLTRRMSWMRMSCSAASHSKLHHVQTCEAAILWHRHVHRACREHICDRSRARHLYHHENIYSKITARMHKRACELCLSTC